MISYGRQTIDEDDIKEVVKVLSSNWLTQGPTVNKFESKLNEFFNSDYCVAVANGTAALHLVAIALGWSKDDVIITSPITFLASANCIEYVNATTDFVDIDPKTYTLDLNLLEQKIKYLDQSGKKVKAIIGVDFAGHPCQWKEIKQIADRYEISLIHDNCHSFGSSINGDTSYAIKHADFVTQSFHPVKHITTGEGGAIFTKDKGMYEKLKLLRSHGMTKNSNVIKNSDGPWYYEMHEIGYNYRITDFQCALGLSQLKKINNFVETRKAIAKVYDKAFKPNNLFKIPHVMDNIGHSYHLYPLCIDFEKSKHSKKMLFEHLRKKNIFLQVHYIPVHLQPYYKNKYGFKNGDFPVSEKFYKSEISLPIFPSLKSSDQNFVIDVLKSFFKV